MISGAFRPAGKYFVSAGHYAYFSFLKAGTSRIFRTGEINPVHIHKYRRSCIPCRAYRIRLLHDKHVLFLP